MGESDRGRERDLVLAPNEFAFISDETKGNINVYVGPHKTSLANTDRPVVFNDQTKRFDRCSLEQATVTGQSGGGLVKVTLSGKGVMTALDIDASLLKPDEKDILEDLILAAHTDAKTKSEAMMAEEMKSVTGGLPLPPGFKLPF